MTEKLQKVLAAAGLGSRRQIESWIVAGRVKVNEKTAPLGTRVSESDRIQLDGKRINLRHDKKQFCQVVLYHKPVGEVCTRNDPEGRKTVFAALPQLKQGRWIAVGRLDINTSGLLLFTNDGELAHRLMHPSYQIEREYAVRVRGEIDKAMLERLTTGVKLEDGEAKFTSIWYSGGDGQNQWFHVTLNEGKNREVRRLWESQNVQVSRLIRVRFGDLWLPGDLARGKRRKLDVEAITALRQKVQLD